MNLEERKVIDRMFKPRGMALFGGMGTQASFGQLVVLSQVKYGYKGRLYPISTKGGEIAGLKVFRSLREVNEPVDLASISVPAEAVPTVLRHCLKNGLAGAQVHSSGFAETGEKAGLDLQREISGIAKRGLRVIGPNCFGLHCPAGGITLLPGFDFSQERGSLSLISQSGGVASDFGHEAARVGLGISKIASYGNGCDLEAVELLDYLAGDPETGLIAMYLEGVGDGGRFLELLKRTTPKKPVVIWKGGLTGLGGRTALSHTGSLGGEARIWESALNQAGAIAVQGLDEMMDALSALYYLKTPARRIALLGGGGAIGVFSSDLAERYGLDLPVFQAETRSRLKNLLPAPGNILSNPLDTGSPALPVETVISLAREVLTREPIDCLLMVMLLRTLEVEMPVLYEMNRLPVPPRGGYLESLAGPLAELREETGKDIVMVLENRAYKIEELEVERVARLVRQKFQQAGFPVFANPERALRGLKHAAQRALGR